MFFNGFVNKNREKMSFFSIFNGFCMYNREKNVNKDLDITFYRHQENIINIVTKPLFIRYISSTP